MKLTFKKVPPARSEFAPGDERFAGFLLHLSNDRRGISEKAWGSAKDPKGKVVGANELAYAYAQTEETIVGWSGFAAGMIDYLGIDPAAFETSGEDTADEPALVQFDRHTRTGLLANSILFDKLAGEAVSRHNGTDEEEDTSEEEEERKNS